MLGLTRSSLRRSIAAAILLVASFVAFATVAEASGCHRDAPAAAGADHARFGATGEDPANPGDAVESAGEGETSAERSATQRPGSRAGIGACGLLAIARVSAPRLELPPLQDQALVVDDLDGYRDPDATPRYRPPRPG